MSQLVSLIHIMPDYYCSDTYFYASHASQQALTENFRYPFWRARRVLNCARFFSTRSFFLAKNTNVASFVPDSTLKHL
jgi:hypothetical protein